ncbi:MAG: DNA polymerase III subunit beta [Gammaproteobacteria bacterium BRH_c0]|nr:MAG: DNA polymerase III subunit beta [Gammaproteobacteria bacterium BRH_c0]
MKFSISREAFLKPLQLVVSVVERRQTLPVLSNVLITLDNNLLSLTGTDLEVEIVGRIELEQAGQGGEITVPARKLVDICKSLPDKSVINFSEDGGRMLITCGKSRFTLSTLPASDFPSVEEGAGQVEFTIAAAALKKLIDDTAFAMAQQDVRYYLNGMLWEASNGLLRAVATDGHRLAMSSQEMPFSLPERIQAIVPRKGVVELSRILADDGDVTVTLGSNHVRIQRDDFRFTSKLVDGAYPDYERVLPKGGSKYVIGDRELLRHAFARTAILSNEKYRGVRLQLTSGLLKITANNPEQEEAEEEVTVDYEGEGELEIGFNVNYLLDVLGVLKGENFRMVLSDANSSALLEAPEADGSVYVIMPMRL